MASFRPLKKASNLWRNNSLVQWSTGIPSPEDLIAVPSYLTHGDAAEAREYYTGLFRFHGELHDTNGSSPFQLETASAQWIGKLHGFSWLRHLYQAESPMAKSNAQTMVRDWIGTCGTKTTGIAWTLEVIANRIIAWLAHAPMIIENVDQEFYSSFLHSITFQTRFLLLSAHSGPEGMPRLLAKIAVAYTSLCIDGLNKNSQLKQINQATNALGKELEHQFYADGGHITRDPDAGISTALVLLPLHQLYLQRQEEPPIQLTNALDRLLPMLEFFAHPDGTIAHFNGGGRLDNNHLPTLLNTHDHSGKPPENATFSGYQKIQAGKTKLLMDTGHSPANALSHNAHAGCLSFEMSSDQEIIIVNCGAPIHNQIKLAQAARSTAAHSTATLNDTSSCQFKKNYLPSSSELSLISPPLASDIVNVPVERSSNELGEQITASHDGYLKQFGITHQRTLFMSTDGETINGSDRFINEVENNKTGSLASIAIRFHLHPNIKTEQTDNGISVSLTTANGEQWKFTCVDARIEIEESVYFFPEYSQTKQIILSTAPGYLGEVRWVFEKIHEQNPAGNRKTKTSSKSTSSDLLDIMTQNILNK